MAEALGAVGGLGMLMGALQAALHVKYEIDSASTTISQIKDLGALVDVLRTTVSAVEEANFTKAEREALNSVVKDGTALIQVGMARIDRLAKGQKRGPALMARLRRDPGTRELSEDLAALSDRLNLMDSLLQFAMTRTLETQTYTDQGNASYLRELESSRPYQTAMHHSTSIEIRTLDDIVFPSRSSGVEGIEDWTQATEDSSDEQESEWDIVSEDDSMRSSFGRSARSESYWSEDDRRGAYDEGSPQCHKDVVLYNEAGQTHQVLCLLDTGASFDCISKTKAREIRYNAWLRRLRSPLRVPVAGNHITRVDFVVQSVWRFDDGTAIYRQKFHVADLEGLGCDILLSRRTIFQYDFLRSTLENSTGSHPLAGINSLLPLGSSNMTYEERKEQEQETARNNQRNDAARVAGMNRTQVKVEADKKARQAARAAQPGPSSSGS